MLHLPSTREHRAVYSELDPLSDDEDDPYALPTEEEETEDMTQVSDIDVVWRHSQAGDGDIVGSSSQTRLQARVAAVNFARNHAQQHQDTITLLLFVIT